MPQQWFSFCGKSEYLWQTLTNGENIGTFPQNDARSGNRDSGVQIGTGPTESGQLACLHEETGHVQMSSQKITVVPLETKQIEIINFRISSRLGLLQNSEVIAQA